MTKLILTLLIALALLSSPLAWAVEPQNKLSILTPEERTAYDQGEISGGTYAGGIVAGVIVGFGLGHAVVGEYSEIGWVFTVGELASLGMVVAGTSQYMNSPMICTGTTCTGGTDGMALATFGALAYVGLHIWEIVDIAVRPANHNDIYRRAREKLGTAKTQLEWHLEPLIANQNIGMGLRLEF